LPTNLANLIAIRDVESSRLDRVVADLEHSGEFARVWRPAVGWAAAVAPLPGSDAGCSIAADYAFAEGDDQVRKAAGGAGASFDAVTDWLDHQPERLSSMAGDFGFIRFRADGAVLVVRSCAGLVPFYLFERSGRAAVATRLGDLARFVRDDFRLDPLVHAAWSCGSFVFPDNRTFLAGVSILERGSWVRLDPNRPRDGGRYWNPRQRRLARAGDHARAQRLRTLLVERLTRDLDPAGGNLLTWSGGVDSSALGALATGAVRRPVSTISLLPAQGHPRYEHEMSYIRPLAKHCAFDPSLCAVADLETKSRALELAPSAVCHMANPLMNLMTAVRRETPVRVLFGGEFADETCGSLMTHPDWARHTSPLRLVTGLGRLPFGAQDVGRWFKHRWLGAVKRPLMPVPETLNSYIHPALQEEYREWISRRQRQAARDRSANRSFHARMELVVDGVVAFYWETTSSLGIRRSFPFLQREVLELTAECHPADDLLARGTKSLLRDAVSDDVPRHNLYRPDKGSFGRWSHAERNAAIPWERPLPDEVQAVVRPEWFPRPPPRLSSSEASALRRLELFVAALAARQEGRAVESNRGRAPLHRLMPDGTWRAVSS